MSKAFSKAVSGVAAFCLSALLLSSAGATPAELKGKSVIVRWTENRVQRLEGHSDFRSFSLNMELAVYVSTQGRVFNRMQSRSGASEQSPGQAMRGGRVPIFSGRAMTIMQPLRGLARRIAVNFDAGFTTCTASVIVGNEAGQSAGHIRAFGTGVRQEVLSVSASGNSCSVRNGNVFE